MTALLFITACWPLAAVAAPAAISISAGASIGSAIFYVAEDQGYFAQQGLKVTIESCNGAFQCMDNMLAGRTNFSNGGDLAVMFRGLERKDFTVLATYANSTAILKLLARTSANVRSAKDLIGKRVGVIKRSAPHYFLHMYLLIAGIDPHQIDQVFLEPDEMSKAFARGEVDVLSTYEPLASKQRGELGKEVEEVPVPPIFSLGVNLVALRRTVAASGPQTVQLLRALDQAQQFIQREPAKAKQIWMKRTGTNTADTEAAWAGTRFKLTLDPSLVTSLTGAARWAQREGMPHTGSLPDFHELIDAGPLRLAKPEGVIK